MNTYCKRISNDTKMVYILGGHFDDMIEVIKFVARKDTFFVIHSNHWKDVIFLYYTCWMRRINSSNCRCNARERCLTKEWAAGWTPYQHGNNIVTKSQRLKKLNVMRWEKQRSCRYFLSFMRSCFLRNIRYFTSFLLSVKLIYIKITFIKPLSFGGNLLNEK